MKRRFANITFAVAAAGFAATNAAAAGTKVTVSGDIKAAATSGNGGNRPSTVRLRTCPPQR